MSEVDRRSPRPGDLFATREAGRVEFWQVERLFGFQCWANDTRGIRRLFSTNYVAHATVARGPLSDFLGPERSSEVPDEGRLFD